MSADVFSAAMSLVRSATSWPAGQTIVIRDGDEGLVRIERRIGGKLVNAYEGAAGEDAPPALAIIGTVPPVPVVNVAVATIEPMAIVRPARTATIHIDADGVSGVICDGPTSSDVSMTTIRELAECEALRFEYGLGGATGNDPTFDVAYADKREGHSAMVSFAASVAEMLRHRGYDVTVKDWRDEKPSEPKVKRMRKPKAAKEPATIAAPASFDANETAVFARQIEEIEAGASATSAEIPVPFDGDAVAPSFDNLPMLDTAPSRPPWLETLVSDPTGAIGAAAPAAPTKPIHASVHLDGSGLHGAIFDLSDVGQTGLDSVMAALRAHGKAIVEPPTRGLKHHGFRAQFNSVLVPMAEQSHLMKRVAGILASLGFEVASADWNAQVVAPVVPAPAPVAPVVVATPVTAPVAASGEYTITIPAEAWQAIDANNRARIKRTMRKVGIGLNEAIVDYLATMPFPKSNAGVLEVLRVLRDLEVNVEPVAA